MTAPQDQYTQVARQGQEAITKAMRTWSENLESMIGGAAPAQSGLPSPQQVVDNVFDFAEQLLASQREFAHRVLAAATEANEAATSTVREAAESMNAHTMAATDAATAKVVDTGQAGDGSRSNR